MEEPFGTSLARVPRKASEPVFPFFQRLIYGVFAISRSHYRFELFRAPELSGCGMSHFAVLIRRVYPEWWWQNQRLQLRSTPEICEIWQSRYIASAFKATTRTSSRIPISGHGQTGEEHLAFPKHVNSAIPFWNENLLWVKLHPLGTTNGVHHAFQPLGGFDWVESASTSQNSQVFKDLKNLVWIEAWGVLPSWILEKETTSTLLPKFKELFWDTNALCVFDKTLPRIASRESRNPYC